MEKKIGTEASFPDGIVIEHDFIMLASQLDELDPEAHRLTRLSGFDELTKQAMGNNGWGYHDLGLDIVSLCVKKTKPNESRCICALDREGDVAFFLTREGKSIIEKIPGAGLNPGDSNRGGVAGYVTHIREIGESLYVCGLNGQIYRRPPEGGWLAIDGGLFKPLTADNTEISNYFTCIDGNDETDIYVVGMQGVVYHLNGLNWQKIEIPTDEHLQWVRCYGKDEVYLCGHNGTLLKGNARQGFVDVSRIEDNLTWWCLCKFGDKVYLSSTQGLYAWDGKTIAPVVTGLKPELETWRVDSDGEKALWSFGTKDLAWFDGVRWQRLHHPSNPKIGDA